MENGSPHHCPVDEHLFINTCSCFFSNPAVKPDPPERVTATPVRLNARRLEVSWHSPSTWPDIDNFPLKYFLRYRPLIREQWQHVSSSQATKAKRIVGKKKKRSGTFVWMQMSAWKKKNDDPYIFRTPLQM